MVTVHIAQKRIACTTSSHAYYNQRASQYESLHEHAHTHTHAHTHFHLVTLPFLLRDACRPLLSSARPPSPHLTTCPLRSQGGDHPGAGRRARRLHH
eukprot:2390328-Pyramimonas_sp.AAC.1